MGLAWGLELEEKKVFFYFLYPLGLPFPFYEPEREHLTWISFIPHLIYNSGICTVLIQAGRYGRLKKKSRNLTTGLAILWVLIYIPSLPATIFFSQSSNKVLHVLGPGFSVAFSERSRIESNSSIILTRIRTWVFILNSDLQKCHTRKDKDFLHILHLASPCSNIVHKNLNELFGQPNTMLKTRNLS